MKHTLLNLLLLMLVSASSKAQLPQDGAPDYEQVKQLTNQKGTALSYDTLLSRFNRPDTTLTIAEVRLLYYGASFSAYSTESDGGKSMDSVQAYYKQDTVTPVQWKKVASFTQDAAKEAPLSLRVLRAQRTAFYLSGDSVAADAAHWKFEALLNAILSTGDGKTDTTAFHVISVGAEYDVLRYFGFQSAGQSLTRNLCDYLELAPNEYELKGIYFDVKQLFKAREKMFSPTVPGTRKRPKKS